MIAVTVAVPENKLLFFKELVRSLDFKEIDSNTEVNSEVSDEQKKLVLERIEKSKPENWLRWDSVKDNFELE